MSKTMLLAKDAQQGADGHVACRDLSSVEVKRILIVAPFTLLQNEEGYNRFRYIAEVLSAKYSVTLVTSSFNHPKKSQRRVSVNQEDLPYQVHLLNEPGYEKNVSIKRINSHRVFEKNLSRYLVNNDGSFEYVYAAFPLIGSAKLCQQYAVRNGIPFYLDVQDVWPESILVIFGRLGGLIRGLLFPLTVKANSVYSAADAVISVSNTYADRVMRVNNKSPFVMPLYIGIDLDAFDAAVKAGGVSNRNASSEVVGVYSGSMSYSYDVETIILASAKVRRKGIPFKLLIVGNGPFEKKLRDLALKTCAPVEFLGYQPFDQMANVLYGADIGFHAISQYSQSSMTNKFADYCAAGLALLNCSSNSEIRGLVENERMGVNYSAGNSGELAKLIEQLSGSLGLLSSFQVRSRDFAENHLDRKGLYGQLFELFN